MISTLLNPSMKKVSGVDVVGSPSKGYTVTVDGYGLLGPKRKIFIVKAEIRIKQINIVGNKLLLTCHNPKGPTRKKKCKKKRKTTVSLMNKIGAYDMLGGKRNL